MKKLTAKFLTCCVFIVLVTGCQSAYYGALEKVGIHKRDVMVSRVEKTKDSQETAKQQFKNALEQFKSVVTVDGGNLEHIYSRLSDEFESSQQAAETVSERIDSVESVSEALFDEWEQELGQYTSESLKRKSRVQLADTRRQYKRLLRAMRRAEKSMQPVLNVFHDQVLFLKHNLNARAIASIKNELNAIELDVAKLVKQMNTSISEANAFISSMNQ